MHEKNFLLSTCDWAIFYFICIPLPVVSRYGPRVLFQTSLSSAIVVAIVSSRPYRPFYSFTKFVIDHVRFRFSESQRMLGIDTYLTTFSVDVAYFCPHHAVELCSHNLFRQLQLKHVHAEACFP